ncbi:MAG: FtsX-like permease family protein [Pseudomonadota bacterium]
MRAVPLFRMLRQNLHRNVRHFALSGLGIAVGVASYVFFLGLAGGMRSVVLGEIFPIDRVEAISPKATLTGAVAVLDEELVEKIRARPEVSRVSPKLKMAFPSRGWGSLLGAEVRFEVGGFCDGIDPVLVEDEAAATLFKDWEEAEAGHLKDCRPRPPIVECPAEHYCGWDWKCHRPVPVLVSRTLLEIYNGSFAPAHGMPQMGLAQQAWLESKLRSIWFVIALGESFIQGTTERLKAAPEQVKAHVVGISRQAMPIGMTVPIGYVRRWNRTYLGEAAAQSYSSIVINANSKDQVASLVSWLRQEGYDIEESNAERFALVIKIVTLLFLLVSVVIAGLSAVNIGHTFLMLIAERKKEIGIMRAVGASRRDVALLIVGEASVIGFAAGLVGSSAGVALASLVDWTSARFVPDFPFKPETYFVFTPSLLASALAFAMVFCLLGALLPARKATKMEPAQALTS